VIVVDFSGELKLLGAFRGLKNRGDGEKAGLVGEIRGLREKNRQTDLLQILTEGRRSGNIFSLDASNKWYDTLEDKKLLIVLYFMWSDEDLGYAHLGMLLEVLDWMYKHEGMTDDSKTWKKWLSRRIWSGNVNVTILIEEALRPIAQSRRPEMKIVAWQLMKSLLYHKYVVGEVFPDDWTVNRRLREHQCIGCGKAVSKEYNYCDGCVSDGKNRLKPSPPKRKKKG
jgi:hypothetical protein